MSSSKLYHELSPAQIKVVLRGCDLTRQELSQLKTPEQLKESLKTWMEAFKFNPNAHLFGNPPRRPLSGCSCCPDSYLPSPDKSLRRSLSKTPPSDAPASSLRSSDHQKNAWELNAGKTAATEAKSLNMTENSHLSDARKPEECVVKEENQIDQPMIPKGIKSEHHKTETVFVEWCRSVGLPMKIGEAIERNGIENVEQLQQFSDLSSRDLQEAFELNSLALGILLKKKIDPSWVGSVVEEKEESENSGSLDKNISAQGSQEGRPPIQNIPEKHNADQESSDIHEAPEEPEMMLEEVSTEISVQSPVRTFGEELGSIVEKISKMDGFLVECQVKACMNGKFKCVRTDILPERLTTHILSHGSPERKKKAGTKWNGRSDLTDSLPEPRMMELLKLCYPSDYLDQCLRQHEHSPQNHRSRATGITVTTNPQGPTLIAGGRETNKSRANVQVQGNRALILNNSNAKTVKVFRNKIVCQTTSWDQKKPGNLSGPTASTLQGQGMTRSASAVPTVWKGISDKENLISQAMNFSQVGNAALRIPSRVGGPGSYKILRPGFSTSLNTWKGKESAENRNLSQSVAKTSEQTHSLVDKPTMRSEAIANLNRTRSQPNVPVQKEWNGGSSQNLLKRRSAESYQQNSTIPNKRCSLPLTNSTGTAAQPQRITSHIGTTHTSFPKSGFSVQLNGTVHPSKSIVQMNKGNTLIISKAIRPESAAGGVPINQRTSLNRSDGSENGGRRRSSRPKPPEIERYGQVVSDIKPIGGTAREKRSSDPESKLPPSEIKPVMKQPESPIDRSIGANDSKVDEEAISSYWELLTTISTLSLQEGTSQGVLTCRCGTMFHSDSEVGDMDQHILTHHNPKMFAYIMSTGPNLGSVPNSEELRGELVYDFKNCFPTAYEKIKDAIGVAPLDKKSQSGENSSIGSNEKSTSKDPATHGVVLTEKSEMEMHEESLAAWMNIAGEDKADKSVFAVPSGEAPKKKEIIPSPKALPADRESPKPMKYFELMANTINNIRKQVRQWNDVHCILRTCSHVFKGCAGSVEVTQYHLENHIEDHAWTKLKIYGCINCNFRSSGKLQMEYHLTTRHRRACKAVKDLKTLMKDHRGDFEVELMRITKTCYPTLVQDNSILPYDPKFLEIEEREEEFEE